MHIFMSITLSLMIILMGNGMLMVHCNHSGKTRIVDYSQLCEKSCPPTAPCMEVTVLKMSTMVQVFQQTLEHAPAIVFLPCPEKPLYEFINPLEIVQDASHFVDRYRYGPPRKYLNLICVLLI